VFADRVNDLGRRAGAAVSMEFYPAYSLRWGRVLRAGTGLAGGLLNRRPAMGRLSRSALAMTAKAVDAASGATGLFARSGQKYIKATVRRPLAASELAAAGDSVIAAHGPIQSLLRPDFQEELVTKRWQLLDRLRPEGVKHHVGVWDPDGQLVGWYLLHCWPTNTAEVVDLVSTPERSHAVVAHVLDQAYDLGVGSVHGGVHPAMQFALTDAGAYFHGRASSTGLYAKCQDLHQAFRQCRAFPSALQGEYPLQVPRQGRVAA